MKIFGPDAQTQAERRQLLVLEGPTLEILISHPRRVSQNELGSFENTRAKALVDTGASQNLLDMNVAAELRLPTIDVVEMLTPSGATRVPMFFGIIEIPILEISLKGRFMGGYLSSRGQPFAALLGRTFLQHVNFSYQGAEGVWYCDRAAGDYPAPPDDE